MKNMLRVGDEVKLDKKSVHFQFNIDSGYKEDEIYAIVNDDGSSVYNFYVNGIDSENFAGLGEDELEFVRRPKKIKETILQQQKTGAQNIMNKTSERLDANDLHAEVCTSDILLSINRMGEFSIEPEQFHSSQCGTSKKVDYKYEVSISAMNNALSKPDMFVMDNMDVERYFQRTYVEERGVCYSCEVMAVRAVKHFRKSFKENYEDIDVRKVHVVIRGSGVSFITATWEKK